MCPPAGLHLYPRLDWGSWSYMVSGLETSLNRGVSLVEVFLAGSGSWGAWLGALCVRGRLAGSTPKPRLPV